MGDAKNNDLRVGFDSRLKLRFCGSQVTSDAGLLAYREFDEALGLTEMGADLLTDFRQGSNQQHLLVPLLRQSIYSRLAGYEDVNDAERLAVGPALRYVVGGRASLSEKQAASASEVGRFETDMLSQRHNLTALMNLSAVDRQGSPAAAAEKFDSRHGQLRERNLRRPRRNGVQRPLRVRLLPPAFSVQPVWRPEVRHASPRQQGQRQILATRAAAGNQTVSPFGHSKVLSR